MPATPLSERGHLTGAGIYALYYTGDFPLYAPLVEELSPKRGGPIYVGKAIPKGGRKGGLSKDSGQGTALRDRLAIHATSIAEASNLDLSHFFFRALVVDDIWIPLGENAIIEWFKPVWNLALDGFGIKVPGKGRLKQRASDWDTLHLGRKLALGLSPNARTAEELEARVAQFFQDMLPAEVQEQIESQTSSEEELADLE